MANIILFEQGKDNNIFLHETKRKATSISISPTSVTLKAASSQQFMAKAYDKYNLSVDVSFSWETNCGSVTQEGLFTAQNLVCQGYVRVKHSNLSADASITIIPAELASMEIIPVSLKIPVASTYQFLAKTYDMYGNLGNYPIDWSCTIGNIDINGFFSSGTTTGSGKVKATSDNFSVESIVEISPGSLFSIVVIPSFAEIEIGSSLQFQGIGYDEFFNSITGLTYLWSVEPGLGSITENGLFTALIVGTGIIKATYGNIIGTASIITKVLRPEWCILP